MRLIVDREQMVGQALNGQGRIANDLYAPFDIAYAKDLPQRQQDLPQAMYLLKQAGHEGLQIELVTSSGIGAGAVEAARLFAKQARGAGVDIRVREVDGGVFYGPNYLQWPFALDYWFTRGYIPQVYQGSQPDSPYNECHWNDARFSGLVHQACGELDVTRRIQLLREAQKIEYDSGGVPRLGLQEPGRRVLRQGDRVRTGPEPAAVVLPVPYHVVRLTVPSVPRGSLNG
jgi:peptide/nickel transport system substrate-binding protein